MRFAEAAKFEGELGFALKWEEDAFPFTYQPPKRLSDTGLEAFSRRNRPFRVEQDASGTLIIMSPVGFQTSRLEVELAVQFVTWANNDGRGVACGPDTGCRLRDGSILAPDALWVPNEKLEAMDRKERDGFLPFCPPFIAEIRSPGDRIGVVEGKMAAWIKAGVELAWLIDPKRQLVKIYRPGVEPETLARLEVLRGEGPIAGFELGMRLFWE